MGATTEVSCMNRLGHREDESSEGQDDPVPQERRAAEEKSPDHLHAEVRYPSSTSSCAVEASRSVADEFLDGLFRTMSAMELVRPEILRGFPVARLVYPLPFYWWRDRPMHSLSNVVREIDEFLSHSWRAPAPLKYINALLLYQAAPAFLVSTALAVTSLVLYGLGALPASDNSRPCIWCTWSGILGFYLALLLSRRGSMVFLDVACIHQIDHLRKLEAMVSMGGFLKMSKSMRVLWDPSYVRRLWCVFEMSAFLHSHGGDASMSMCPLFLGPTLLGGHFAFSVGAVIMLHWQWNSNVGRAVFTILLIPFFTYAVHTARAYFRSIDLLDEQLRQFSVDGCTSSCCEAGHPGGIFCDRQVLLRCISTWFGSVEEFEERVRTDVRARMVPQLAKDMFTYPRILLVSSPALWMLMDSIFTARPQRFTTQLGGLSRALAYWLGAFPVAAKAASHVIYKTRARFCNTCLDTLVSVGVAGVAVAIWLGINLLEENVLWRFLPSRWRRSVVFLVVNILFVLLLFGCSPSVPYQSTASSSRGHGVSSSAALPAVVGRSS